MSKPIDAGTGLHFSELVHESYGSHEELAEILDLGIEMLFYIEEDAFERREIQNVVSAIRSISSFLRYQD